ncbi:MAG TPA: 3-methyl-2-oxobutanoate hydroxymethyltransferase, partial [Myxococcota bacterium]|nr:3-methyl-2-oxobutanoate hydroxymethyltransferase [Myxococcota bacterium]
PQSVHQFGGFKVQGRAEQAAEALVADARAVQDAGAYAIVLESVPAKLARRITDELAIPTIGIGASANCDGQVLVLYDLLGMDPSFNPKFLKKYEDLATRIRDAVGAYGREVREGAFPDDAHSFSCD